MGIYIHMAIADTVTQEEWTPVYEKSLLMAKKLGFFDFGKRKIHGENVFCIFPSEEMDYNGETGWRVIGRFPEYKRAEDQFMPKHLPDSQFDQYPYDMLRTRFPEQIEQTEEQHGCEYIWGNKTQGEPYHMGLLAIACMVEQELGVQVITGGDITYGQCVKAAEIATEVLGEEIKPPITCRLNDLHERISGFTELDEETKLAMLMNVYLAEENDQYGEFLRQHYSHEALNAYWSKCFSGTKVDTYGFNKLMKRYFLLSTDLKRFCELADFDRTDAEMCTKLIQKIMRSSLHLKEKDCYDPLDLKHYEIPYGVMNLLAIFTYRDAVNPAIDRYIPLNEIRAVLTEQFGSVVNVNEIIDNYLTEEENRTEATGHELLMKEGQEYSKKWDEDHKQYDICEFEELIEFTPNSTFSPEMTEVIAKSFKVCLDCAATPECKALLDKSADEMFHVLVSKFKSFYLADKHWEHIYSELCRDTQTFKRFYPIIRVTHSEKLEYLVRAFVLDDTFWNYCCEHFSKEVSDELDQITDTQEGS